MNHYDVKRLALVLALQAEIEGMKAENTQRELWLHELTYNEGHFQEMAEKIRYVAHCHNEQL
jgi:hypothetical protein